MLTFPRAAKKIQQENNIKQSNLETKQKNRNEQTNRRNKITEHTTVREEGGCCSFGSWSSCLVDGALFLLRRARRNLGSIELSYCRTRQTPSRQRRIRKTKGETGTHCYSPRAKARRYIQQQQESKKEESAPTLVITSWNNENHITSKDKRQNDHPRRHINMNYRLLVTVVVIVAVLPVEETR